MKKILLASLAIFVMASCEKEHGLDNDYLVYTNYDNTADFKDYNTFYIPDKIMTVSYSVEPDYIEGDMADRIVRMYVDNMESMGYTRVENKEDADLGIQLTYISDTHHFVSYIDSPYWWWGYSGYWLPSYWGNWGYWYYPYPVSYSYSEGSLLTDMVDLKAKQGEEEKLPVIWNSYISGLSTGSKYIDTSLLVRGVSQSFLQSGYLKK